MAKKRLPDWDDGRTIASMNVDGMPGYREPAPAPREDPDHPGQPVERPVISGQETRWMIFGSLKAALLVAGVFSVALAGFAGILYLLWK